MKFLPVHITLREEMLGEASSMTHPGQGLADKAFKTDYNTLLKLKNHVLSLEWQTIASECYSRKLSFGVKLTLLLELLLNLLPCDAFFIPYICDSFISLFLWHNSFQLLTFDPAGPFWLAKSLNLNFEIFILKSLQHHDSCSSKWNCIDYSKHRA